MSRNKIFTVIAALLCFISALSSCGNYAVPPEESQFTTGIIETSATEKIDVLSTSATQPVQPTTTIPQLELPYHTAAALYCSDMGEFIYSENIYNSIAPASMTKLLTACVALNYVDSSELCYVGSELQFVQPYSSMCYISPGEILTMHDLITGLLLSSGNDAAYTIAVTTARILNPDIYLSDSEAVEYFVELMNQFAVSIGMTGSNFMNPDGWDNWSQYTTVSDLLILTQYAMNIWEIREIVGWSSQNVTIASGEYFTWHNSNRLLDPYDVYYCPNAIGAKTGSTVNAGYCLIAAFVKDGHLYFTIVSGCDSDENRYEATLELFGLC